MTEDRSSLPPEEFSSEVSGREPTAPESIQVDPPQGESIKHIGTRVTWRDRVQQLKDAFSHNWHGLAEKVHMLRFRSHSRRHLHNQSPAEIQLKRMRLLRTVALVFLGLVVVGIVAFFGLFAWFSRDLPKPGQIVRQAGFSTKIFDRNGVLLYDLFEDERRTPVTFSQLPDNLKHAVVAIEDKDFYKNPEGFDYLTLLRIPYNIVMKQRVVGGSTLTQQLVKNVLLSNERTLTRKFKEIVLSVQIARTFSKDQILEMYLNEAPYGGTAWGVGTASEIYFNKKVSDLTLAEAAILAGLPQRPSVYSPYSGKHDESGDPYWKVRARGVLAAMRKEDYLTELTYQQGLKDLDTVVFRPPGSDLKAPHFVFYVRDELEKMYGEDVAAKGGLQVTTSLDLGMQEEAQKIVFEEVEKVKNLNITNGAAMVVNPKTGEILAMVGSKDYSDQSIDGQYNVAVTGERQPGSSIKPVTYLGMLKLGYTPSTMLIDTPTSFTPNEKDKPYEPKNYDGKFRGPVSLRNSLGSSLNITAVKSLATVGVKNFLQLAYDMGFVTLAPTEKNLRDFGLAVTLGGGEVHLIDTVSAYSAFANGGLRVNPVSILKVQDQTQRTLFEFKPVPGPRVMTPEEAFLINNILSDNNARLMAFGANSLLNTGKAIAVKTGTTNDQKDNWAIGWSQEVMVGTWVGNSDNTAMKHVASGVTGASPIWRRIILMALTKGFKAPDWIVPEGVEQVELDDVSGYLKHDDFPAHKEYVIKGTAPALPDPIHTKLKLCRGENKLATDAKIAAGDFNERESIVLKQADLVSQDGVNRWQQGIDSWIAGQTDDKYKTPTEYCGNSSDTFVKVTQPGDQQKLNETDVQVKVEADSGDGIDKIEIWVDGGLRETVNNHVYDSKINLSGGQHEIYAKAWSRGGATAQSSTIRIGTGGQDWKKPDPTAVPTAKPTSAPTSPPAAATPTSPPAAATPTSIVPTILPTTAPTPTPA